MKYCRYCGNLLDDSASFCTACGKPQGVITAPVQAVTPTEPAVFAYLAVVFGALGGILGLVFSLLGLAKCKEKKNRKLCYIGLTCFGIWAILSLVYLIKFIVAIS